MPFKGDLVFISKRFDGSVLGLFEFSRFLFLFSFLIALICGYLIYLNIVNFDYENDNFFCRSYIPCFFFYSRFKEENKFVYASTIVIGSIVMLVVCFKKWLQYKKRYMLQELFDGEEGMYGRLFFNNWDWRVINATHLEDQRYRILNTLMVGVKEEQVKENIKWRTIAEARWLKFKRVLSGFLSIFVLLIGSIIILSGYVLQGYLSSLSTNAYLKFFIDLVPGLSIQLSDIVLPWLFEYLIKFEAWDYQNTVLNQKIWRNFFSQSFNLFIVYFLNVWYILYDKTSADLKINFNLDFGLEFTCPGDFTVPALIPTERTDLGSSIYNNCREDEMVYNFLANVF